MVLLRLDYTQPYMKEQPTLELPASGTRSPTSRFMGAPPLIVIEVKVVKASIAVMKESVVDKEGLELKSRRVEKSRTLKKKMLNLLDLLWYLYVSRTARAIGINNRLVRYHCDVHRG